MHTVQRLMRPCMRGILQGGDTTLAAFGDARAVTAARAEVG